MHPQFLGEHRTWLATQLPNTTERLAVALAVCLPIRVKSLVELRVKDVWSGRQMLPFVAASMGGPEGCDVLLPLPESLADLVVSQVSAKAADDFLFADQTGRHIASSHVRALLLSLGLFGKCGSEAIRNCFGRAVNSANGRTMSEQLRRSDVWLWSDRELFDEGGGAIPASCYAALRSATQSDDDFDHGWRLIHGLRRAETPEERLLSAEYFVRSTLWVAKPEADAIAKMLGREYPSELHELWKRGILARYSVLAPGSEAATIARPRDLVDFWADVPEHLRLYGLIESLGEPLNGRRGHHDVG